MNFIFAAGRGILNFIYLFHKLFPVKNRISFISRQNEEPSLDIQLLADKLKELSPDTEIVIADKMIGSGFSGKLKYFLHMITKQMHLLATSKVIILDGYCIAACMLRHKKDLKIVQMWHAMGALKKFGWASAGQDEGYSETIAKGMRMHKGYTTVFVGSKACRELMAPAFGCSPDIMQVMPLPRCDLILSKDYNEDIRDRIYEAYPDIKGKEVILYAPTFRKNSDISGYVKELIDAVDFEKYALAVKLHPLDKKRIVSDKAIIDTVFSSMQWLCCADHVVTDYSAIVFEAALAQKPIYRYVPDLESYKAQRGLFDVFDEVPGAVSESAQQIAASIGNNDLCREEIREFSEKYTEIKQNNSEAMAGYILGSIRQKRP